MQTKTLGATGLQVSALCLGTMQFIWRMDERASFRLLDAFADLGGNFIDTADMYSQWAPGLKGGEAETVLGKWMKERGNRSRIVLATKVRCRMWAGADGEGLGRAHILKACDDSLRRLRTDAIDLYQAHWPDENTPIAETLGAFASLAAAGKIRWAGASNYSAEQLEESFEAGVAAGMQFASLQPHYNLVRRKDFESQTVEIVRRRKLGVIPYSPLAGGFLTGRYRKGRPLPETVRAQLVSARHSDAHYEPLELLDRLAARYGKSVAQVALAWLHQRDWVTSPIIGPNSEEQLSELAQSLSLRLDPADERELDARTAAL